MRDILLYIEDILDCITRIELYIEGVDEKEFTRNLQLQDAIIRRLEIIGEAVKHIPDGIRVAHAEIPWSQIAGLRDVLIHEYFGVQIKRTWRVIIDDVPRLKMIF